MIYVFVILEKNLKIVMEKINNSPLPCDYTQLFLKD